MDVVHHCPGLSHQLLKTQFKHQEEGGCPPFPSHNLSQSIPGSPWQGLYGQWSQVQADMQELRRECCLARAMEIQSLELPQQENQSRGKILKGVFATAYTQKPAGNSSSQCWKPQRASWEEACTRESRDQLAGRPGGHRKGHGNRGSTGEPCEPCSEHPLSTLVSRSPFSSEQGRLQSLGYVRCSSRTMSLASILGAPLSTGPALVAAHWCLSTQGLGSGSCPWVQSTLLQARRAQEPISTCNHSPGKPSSAHALHED